MRANSTCAHSHSLAASRPFAIHLLILFNKLLKWMIELRGASRLLVILLCGFFYL